MPSRRLIPFAAALLVLAGTTGPAAAQPVAASPTDGPPQGTQSDASYARSFATHQVTNVDATGGAISCYRPEVEYLTSLGPTNGYSGMSPCPGATTGENTGASGPYPTQIGSNPGYPAGGPKLVKDHSESDIRV